jgi:hypothetical protein
LLLLATLGHLLGTLSQKHNNLLLHPWMVWKLWNQWSKWPSSLHYHFWATKCLYHERQFHVKLSTQHLVSSTSYIQYTVLWVIINPCVVLGLDSMDLW